MSTTPSFTIPGLMPATPAKERTRHKARADGALDIIVACRSVDDSDMHVQCALANEAGAVLVADVACGNLVTETFDGSCVCYRLKLAAGILPIGLVTLHVKTTTVHGSASFFDIDVEVPASPYHVLSAVEKPSVE